MSRIVSSLTARLVLSIGLLMVVGTLAVAVSAFLIMQQIKVNGPVYDEIVLGKDLVADVLPPPEYIIESYLVSLQMLNERDPTRLAALIERGRVLKEGEGGYDQRHAYWAATLPKGELRAALIETAHSEAMRFFELRNQRLVPLLTAGRYDEGLQLANGELRQVYERHRAAIDVVVAMANTFSAANEDRARQVITWGWLVLGMVTLATMVGALGLLVMSARRIVTAVTAVSGALTSLAGGDLTSRVEITRRDEIGIMASNLNHTVDGLRIMVGNIGHSAQGIAGAAEELSAVSKQLTGNAETSSVQSGQAAAAATEVAASINTCAAGIEEMDSCVAEIAKNASQAANVATDSVAATDQADAVMARLGTSSSEIGDIVKLITSIAEQTNLLALNATIEAARAGDAGRGFAVVASEVKDLARKTGEATADIGKRVASIQGDTQAAQTALHRIREIVGKINDLQQSIASAVEEQSATTRELTNNISQVAQASNGIAQNVTAVAGASKEASAGAADTLKAAQELAKLAAGLHQAVLRFTV